MINKEDLKNLHEEALGLYDELGEILQEIRDKANERRRLFKYYDDLDKTICEVRGNLSETTPSLSQLRNLFDCMPEDEES